MPPLACMAPRFSISWSGLEDPRRTELTPSFLRHHARNKVTRWSGTQASRHSVMPDPNVCQSCSLYLKNSSISHLNLPFPPPALPGRRCRGQRANHQHPPPLVPGPAVVAIVGFGFPHHKSQGFTSGLSESIMCLTDSWYFSLLALSSKDNY